MTSKERQAKHILDGILLTLDKAGRYTGKGKNRTLTLSLVVTKDGRTESVYNRLCKWVEAQL